MDSMPDSSRDPRLRPVLSELRAARASLEAMAASDSLESVEDHWRAFLSTLEKVWAKLDLLGGSLGGGYPGWRSKYSRLRKTDPLLCYLHHARNADTHTLQSTTKVEPGSMRIIGGPGGWEMTSMALLATGELLTEGKGDLRIEFHPSTLRGKPVLDRQVRYDPPSEHLGQPLTSLDPMTMADAGLRFYAEVTESFERHFLT